MDKFDNTNNQTKAEIHSSRSIILNNSNTKIYALNGRLVILLILHILEKTSLHSYSNKGISTRF